MGTVRRVTENGREYLVAPLTLIVHGVLPGNRGPLYYPPKEIGRDPSIWNGVPLVLNHPTDPINGEHLSASSPGVYDRVGLGWVRNAHFDGTRLRAEGWFDASKTQQVDKRVYAALNSGQPIELSTGLYTVNDPAPDGSTFNGRPYTHVARSYVSDHVAILPDSRGACSIDDGCGVLVNRRGDPDCPT